MASLGAFLRFFVLFGVLPVAVALLFILLSHTESGAFSSVLTGDLANESEGTIFNLLSNIESIILLIWVNLIFLCNTKRKIKLRTVNYII